MIIKCGISGIDKMALLIKCGVDCLGLNFKKDSSDCLRMISSNSGIFPDYPDTRFIEQISEMNKSACNFTLTGVFADDMPQNIITRISNYHLDYVQLDGDESRVMIENLRRSVVPDIAGKLGIIKAVTLNTLADLEICATYEGVVDYFLFKPGADICHKELCHILNNFDGTTPYIIYGVKSNQSEDCFFESKCHKMFAGIELDQDFICGEEAVDIDNIRKMIHKYGE